MTDEVAERVHNEEKTVWSVVCGAWSEALAAPLHHQVLLVPSVAFMTIPFAPFWVLFALLEEADVYDVEEGWFP